MGARAMIDCICCGRCGKWATATGGGMCEACVVRETRDTEITALRAELAAAKAKMQEGEGDCRFCRGLEGNSNYPCTCGLTYEALATAYGNTLQERTALAAHVERLRAALEGEKDGKA